MAGRIQNEEQYQNSLKWLVEKAKELEHPLMSEEDKQALMKKYDYVQNEVQGYNNDFFKDKYYPSLEEDKQEDSKPAVNVDDWL